MFNDESIDDLYFDIPEFEGIYSINKKGIVKSEGRWVNANKGGEMFIKGRLFTGWKGSKGYMHIKLCKNGINTPYKIHQLLALVFIPNPNNYPCVRHLNDIKDDNRIENLAWGTRKDNAYDQMKNGIFKSIAKNGEHNFMFGKKGKLSPNYGRRGSMAEKYGELNHMSKLILDNQTGIFYQCLREAAFVVGMPLSTLSRKLNGYSHNTTSLIYV